MSNWFHRFFNPHCPHCASERAEAKVCMSCDTLRTQLAIVTHENQKLLDRLLEKPQVEPVQKLVEMTVPKNIPWNVRRQMLEAEDREKARLMRSAPQPVSVEDLEKEMNVASEQREAAR